MGKVIYNVLAVKDPEDPEIAAGIMDKLAQL